MSIIMIIWTISLIINAMDVILEVKGRCIQQNVNYVSEYFMCIFDAETANFFWSMVGISYKTCR